MTIAAFSLAAAPTPVTSNTIANETVAVANTEQSYAFPSGTRRFRLFNRGSGIIKFTFTATESGTKYVSLYPDTHYGWMEIDSATSFTVYFQSTIVNAVLEIDTWA